MKTGLSTRWKRWRRYASANSNRVVALCSVFGLALFAAVGYAAHEQGSFFSSVKSGEGGLAGAVRSVQLVGASDLDPNDPVKRFSETKVGQLLFANAGSDNCQRMLIDNKIGLIYPCGAIECGQQVEQVIAPESTDHFAKLRKSFQR